MPGVIFLDAIVCTVCIKCMASNTLLPSQERQSWRNMGGGGDRPAGFYRATKIEIGNDLFLLKMKKCLRPPPPAVFLLW